MMLPLATDVRMRSLPYANSFLVALTVIAYLAIGPAHAYEHHPFILTYWSPSGILGHIFMHGDFWHLAGNMLFLWVFGNAVCSRIGNLWYPLLYLGLGVVTAMLAMPEPGSGAVGASAAINGIIGLFIILFPLSRIKMLITMLYAWGDILWLPSVFMVGLWFAFDVYGLATGAGRVGYGAHIAGLLSGGAGGCAGTRGNCRCFTSWVWRCRRRAASGRARRIGPRCPRPSGPPCRGR